ncbi:hypothetical protein MLD38_036538 [Melastoma candidum]|uniref:Uncharacterized protein n=1 Tax=Melastoma candidum TaxID=119954 RepID=A0ACB9LLU9_9MYRT|nr:hypothetical protein MLD38_036538 [Melastoma candidum]
MSCPAALPVTTRHVAVIGAGAAGLVAARELRREGHGVVVFERSNRVGGTWVYTKETESDPLGIDGARNVIQSSMYSSLRTNLPREVMGFRDYPFVATGQGFRGDPRRFPGHEEVLGYLERFGREFGLVEGGIVRFEKEARRVWRGEDGRWKVAWMNGRELAEEVFDAVVVCNGHFTEPRLAEICGIDTWPGKQMHSHNYRTPDPFHNQAVVLIGSSASAVDISRDISPVASEVHVACRCPEVGSLGKQPGHDNMWIHPMIDRVCEDGTVIFLDGSSVRADVIMHCTGYKYHFPFLETDGIVTVDDNCVGPLYKHVFPPLLAPWLSFVGLPWKVIPFPQFEHQTKWIAGALSGRIALPSQKAMSEDVDSFYSDLEAAGVPKRYTHNMANYQFDYNDWLARETGCDPTEEWRKQMYRACSLNRHARPETYRDEWDDHEWIAEAYVDLAKYT